MIFKLFLNDLNSFLSEIYEKKQFIMKRKKNFRLLLQKMQLGTAKRRVTSLLGSIIMVGGLLSFFFGVWTTKNFLVRYSIP